MNDKWITSEWVSGEVQENKPSLWQKVEGLIFESVLYLMSALLFAAVAFGALFVVAVLLRANTTPSP